MILFNHTKATEMLYAGIGSRQTPADVLNIMTYIGEQLGKSWTLRSGHADGADMAFENGAKKANGKMQIFLPWNGYNGGTVHNGYIVPEFRGELIKVASANHPVWNRLSLPVQKMHARNVCQILGINCNAPVDMVVCWTPEAKSGGGTGQAIRIAKSYGIPVFDLASEEQRKQLIEFTFNKF